MNKGRENVTNANEGTSELMFLSCQETQEARNYDLWLLDSGCNNHMTSNKKLFSSLDNSVKSEIKLGDYHYVNVVGKGTISILSKQKEKKNIPNVYLVPGLKHDLMRVGQLSLNGYEVIFKGLTCTILDKSTSRRIIEKIQMARNRMFPLILRNFIQSQ